MKLKMKIKNEKELFDLFVEKYASFRNKLKTPFLEKGMVCASDGHLLIMINKECLLGDYEEKSIIGDLPVNDYNSDFPISVQAFEQAIDRCPKEEVAVSGEDEDCPECNGYGKVRAEYTTETDGVTYYTEMDCPVCNGTGYAQDGTGGTYQKVVKKHSLIKIGEGFFYAKHIVRFVKACKLLQVENVRMVRNSEESICIFALNDDVRIVIMPTYTTYEMPDAEVKLGKQQIKV